MAGDRTVEFVLRARDDATKTFERLRDVFGDLGRTQEDVADELAASNAEFAQLRSTAKALESAYDSLRTTLGSVSKALKQEMRLGELNKELAEQAKLVKQATANQAEAAANAKRAGDAYRAQADELKQLTTRLKEVDARQKELSTATRIIAEYEKLSASLDEYTAKQEAARGRVAELTSEVQRLTAAQARYRAEQARLEGATADVRAANTQLQGALELVEAFRKQRAEVEATNAKLDEQRKRLEAAQAAVTARGDTGTKKQQAEIDRLQQSITKLSTAQEKANAALGAAAAKLAEADIEATDLEATERSLKDAIDRNNSIIARQARAFDDAGNAAKGAQASIKTAEKSIVTLNKELSNASNGKTQGIEQRIAGINKALDALAAQAKEAGLRSADLVRPLADLEAEMAALKVEAASAPGALARLEGALANLRNEYQAAARGAAEADADLARAGATYNRVEGRVNELRAAMAPLAAELTKAGVSTDRLADEQNRLQGELDQTSKQAKRAAQATREVVVEQEKSARAQKNGIELQRTSLSLYQRFRGQVLGLTAGYIGLYSAITQVTEAFRAGAAQRGVENTLSAINGGDAARASEELVYIRNLADAVGQEYLAMAKSYGQFRAAVADKLPLEQQRFLFESIAKAATVLRLSVEDSEGTFRALSQIFSKGKVSAEELRQQLGDRLPGAVRLLAQGLGITEAELNKLLETGALTAENILFLAKQVNNEFGRGLTKALQSPQAQLNLLRNRLTDLRIEFERAAENAGLGEALAGIREAISSPEFQRGVRSLAEAFVGLLEALPFVIDNIGVLGAVIGTVIGVQAVASVQRYIAALAVARVATVETTVATGGLRASLALTASKMAGVVGVAFTLYEALKLITETNGSARRAFALWAAGADKALTEIAAAVQGFQVRVEGAFRLLGQGAQSGVRVALAAITKLFKQTMADLDLLLTKSVNSLVDRAAGLADALGNNQLAAKIRSARAKVDMQTQLDAVKASNELLRIKIEEQEKLVGIAKDTDAKLAAVDAERERRLERYNNAIDAMVQEAAGGAARGPDGAAFRFAEDPDLGKPNFAPTGKDKAGADEFLKFFERLQNRINEIANDAASDNAQTLEQRLAVIRGEFQNIIDDIEKLANSGRPEAAVAKDFLAIVDKRIEQLQQQETEVFAQSLADTSASRYAMLQAQLQARQAAVEGDMQSGLLTTGEAEQRIRTLADEALPDLRAALDEVILRQQEYNTLSSLSDEERIAGQTRLAQLQAERNGLVAVGQGLLSNTEKQAAFSEAISTSFQGFSEGLYNAITGMGDLGDAFDNAGRAFLSFASQFLMRLADMILQAAIFRAIAGTALGGFLGIDAAGAGTIGGSTIPANIAHTGAVIGNGSLNRTREVSAAWFANARRFHTGGLPGLKPNEVPTILEKGEEVLSKSDPRNARNGGRAAEGGGSQPMAVKIVNAIDSPGVLEAAMDTSRGEKAIFNHIRANRDKYRSLLA